mgnify:CR=1 FL=1
MQIIVVLDFCSQIYCQMPFVNLGPEFEKFGTKVAKSGARFLAQECFRAFTALSEDRPAVRTDLQYAEAYGPFLEFVTNIFEALEIDASAEAFAREACAELRQESSIK